MDLDPNYIKENLHQIGIKDSKALLKEWIDNSNDIELRKSALRIYSSIDDGKSFKYFEQLVLSDENVEIRILSGEILREKYRFHKKFVAILDFVLNSVDNLSQKFQALDILRLINTKKTKRIILDFLKKSIKTSVKLDMREFSAKLGDLDYDFPISDYIMEFCYNLMLYDYYVNFCGYNATLRDGVIILLNCEGANLTKISDIQAFEKLINLEHLLLQRNNISRISNLEPLKNLKVLNLSYNNIEKIENLESLTSLEELILTGNEIRTIENLNLPNLRKLFLDRNLITEISNLGELSTLETLNLSQNKISEIENLDPLSKLKNLSLSHNRIGLIKGFQNLENLISLHLNDNEISILEGVEKLSSLKVLSLSNNRIFMINNLDNLRNLLKLELSNNAIKKIEGLDNLSKLQELFLDKNKISIIEGLNDLSSLIILFLEKNNISEFKINQIEHLKNLNFIFLNDNPLTPDSREAYLKKTRFP